MATRFSINLNRSVGLLAASSLLISALVIFPTPLKAADPAPDYGASLEACPGNIIPSAGFVDVSAGHPSAGDIDCIAYYGITKGTSATTFSPDRPVIREHMALFLVRFARLVGINLPPAGETPFEDVADLKPLSRGGHQPDIPIGDYGRRKRHYLCASPECQPRRDGALLATAYGPNGSSGRRATGIWIHTR